MMSHPDVVLIGGQAVSYWSAFFESKRNSNSAGLYTSKDIDFEGRAESVRQAGVLLGGRVLIPEPGDATPSTGQVVFLDRDGVEREVDFLAAPAGLDPEDVRKTAIRVEVPDPDGDDKPVTLWVIHPERCMESRIKNWVLLRKQGPIAEMQLRRSISCAREFSKYILESPGSLAQSDRRRAVLSLNERIFKKCVQDLEFQRLYREFGIDPFEATLDHHALPEKFREVRFPQMRQSLSKKRAKNSD